MSKELEEPIFPEALCKPQGRRVGKTKTFERLWPSQLQILFAMLIK